MNQIQGDLPVSNLDSCMECLASEYLRSGLNIWFKYLRSGLNIWFEDFFEIDEKPLKMNEKRLISLRFEKCVKINEKLRDFIENC